MNIFVSYSSHNRAAVKALVADLVSLNHDAWYDQELSGGQVWWDTILDRIRACDLFLFAMSTYALKSNPCKLEYTYAYELGKPILPVLLSDDVHISLVPVILQERQFVNYINQDKAALLALNDAIRNTPPAPALPPSLPEPPGIPISPLAALQEEIEKPGLSYDEQVFLFHQVKGYMDDPDFRADALQLLQELEQHPSLLAAVFKEINTYLAAVAPGRAPHDEPSPAPQPARSGGGQGPTAGMAQVIVRRPNEWTARLREYQVHIDGQKVGGVGNHSEAVFEVTPGAHTIQAKMDFYSTATLTFETAPGDSVHFRCKWQMNFLGGKLVLEQEP
jgi:hypothetical protein